MLVHMAIHRDVKPGKEAEVIEAMKAFGRAMQGKPGVRQCWSLRDPARSALVGLAVWDSPEALAEARPDMARALVNVDFSQLEDSVPDVYALEVEWAAGELLTTAP